MEQIEPFYPRGERGRPPIGCEKMLRLYLMFEELNLRLKRQGILMCEGTKGLPEAKGEQEDDHSD